MGKTPDKCCNVRKMTASDVEAVAKVEADAFPFPWPASFFAGELENPLAVYLVLEAAGEISGYAGFWMVLREAQVINIAVHSRARGRGMGELLVGALAAAAARLGAESIILEARASNNVAQALYAKAGFVRCGLRRGYYQDTGEDAVLMRKIMTRQNSEND
ncbi:MAG: ribosomal protein S18-alanine N-acetyltransferase [Acidaminococcales bacterium]|jgi:ribosomal-protein-alanine N-acetyltransferase|nr:ribosomal protein S18-alanine N-acetyltransferase [Acidaminococcales bacterium]